MSLENFSQEQLRQKSMVELTGMILKEAKKAMSFHEIFEQIAEIKGFTEEQKEEVIAQFYTELNVDGRFVTLGSNIWGLKEWYSIDQVEEEVTPAPKKRKKKKVDDDFEDDVEILDEDEDLDYDDDDILELDDDEEVLDEDDELEFDDELYEEDLDEDLDDVPIEIDDEDEKL